MKNLPFAKPAVFWNSLKPGYCLTGINQDYIFGVHSYFFQALVCNQKGVFHPRCTQARYNHFGLQGKNHTFLQGIVLPVGYKRQFVEFQAYAMAYEGGLIFTVPMK